eukprot:TRINITY_DN3285_c0_g1_i1.p1 TRINITY_DN3285_c0_g1~~TRINITY_DN3285_c0_g1_i1.p1  ORF type:complete len:324 (-),score=75.37 TRINITY_DN3285_c0_g1_i1:184-1056(-)
MSRHITREELAAQFHLPISQAAKNVGVCTTVLKKVCRSYGILRWPQRKVSALNKRVAAYETELRYAHSPERRALLADFIAETRQRLHSIMAGPSSSVKSEEGSMKRHRDDMSISSNSAEDTDEVKESPREIQSTGGSSMDLLLNAISYIEHDAPSASKRPRLAPAPTTPFSGEINPLHLSHPIFHSHGGFYRPTADYSFSPMQSPTGSLSVDSSPRFFTPTAGFTPMMISPATAPQMNQQGEGENTVPFANQMFYPSIPMPSQVTPNTNTGKLSSSPSQASTSFKQATQY